MCTQHPSQSLQLLPPQAMPICNNKVHNNYEVRALFKQVQGEVPGSPIFIMKIYTCWVMTLRSGPEDKKRSSLLLEFMGSYLAELSLLDYSCLRFLPSVVAASSIFIARLTNGPDTNLWGKEMHKLTGYRASELKDCIIAIHDLQLNRKGLVLPAIRDKYKQHRFKCVSMLLPPVEIPTSYFQDLTPAHLDRSTIKLITPSSSRAPCDKGELQFQSRFSDKLE